MKNQLIYGMLACLTALTGTGCTQEEEMNAAGNNPTGKVIITGSIENTTTVQSRVNKDNLGFWAQGGFAVGDAIGIYSQFGDDRSEESRYNNVCLTYTSVYDTGEGNEDNRYYQTFDSDALGDVPSNWGYVCAYYPYSSSNTETNASGESIINIYDSDEPKQLIDLLEADNTRLGNDGMIHFSFTHMFSILFVFPGTGFTNAINNNPDGITVVLKEGVENVSVSDDRRSFKLNKSASAPKEFQAIVNKNALEFNGKLHNAGTFFYTLLPSETEVDYIVIKDDFEKTQNVHPTQVSSADNTFPILARNTRYPITITMTGTEPTIWPGTISGWTQETIEEIAPPTGIYRANFVSWIAEYLEDPSSANTDLEAYGSYSGTADEGQWTFNLYEDIDFSTDHTGAATLLIEEFDDILDGGNHTLSNITLSDDTPGFIGKLIGNGIIKNLRLDNVRFTATGNTAIGGIVNEMEGGTIENCKMNGLYIDAQGPVGAIVGNITGGTLQDNTYNGILIGTISDAETNYIIGARGEETNIIMEGNRSADVTFQSITPATEDDTETTTD